MTAASNIVKEILGIEVPPHVWQQFIFPLGCGHGYWSKDQLRDGEATLSGSDEQRCAPNNAGLAARGVDVMDI